MKILLFCLLFSLICAAFTHATPSTEYWTPCIIDIQAPGTTHLGIDNYFTVAGKNGQAFPTDIGQEWGIKLTPKLMAEIGFDLMAPSNDPLSFNAKVGLAEGAIGKGAPGLALGIFNVGTHRGVNNQNIIDVVIGKTLPNNLGRFHVGGYWGNSDVLRSSNGDKANSGVMVAWDRWLKPDKVMLSADYASGKNAIGGGGVGIYYFFTKDISLLAGPVWFNDKGINGKMKWTTQLDVTF